MARFSGDPRWIEARFASRCAKCGDIFRKGERIYYYPATKTALSGKCAEEAAADFQAMAADEEMIGG